MLKNGFFIAALALVCLLAFQSPAGAASAFESQLLRTKFLESELALAQKTRFYLVFDLEKSEVHLKARGQTFRTWPILKFQQLGAPLPVEVLALQKTNLSADTFRVKIKPPDPNKSEEENEAERQREIKERMAKKAAADAKKEADDKKRTQTVPNFDALELPDMPSDFIMYFPKNVQVHITEAPAPKKDFKGKVSAWAKRTKEAYELYKKKSSIPPDQTLVNISLEEMDAKNLYWSIGESISVIFWAPLD